MSAADPMPRPRRGRPPKGQEPLSFDRVVVAALALVDEEGVEGVSMRGLARALGVNAMSLYNHVSDKDQLLDAVAEHLLGQLEMPTPSDSAVADLRALAFEFRRVCVSHPRAAMLVLVRPLTSVAGLAPVEAVLSVLRRCGIPAAETVPLLRTLMATLIGTLLREFSASPTFGSDEPLTITQRQAELAQSGFVEVEAAAPFLAHFDAPADYAYTVDALVTLIEAIQGREQRS